WADAADATSKVLGAGEFENRWMRYGARGGRALHGFFAVGDSQIETNPMYGRGCTFAFLQAEALADALAVSTDPIARARRYAARCGALLKPTFDLSVTTDRMFRNRARVSRGESLGLGERLLKYLYERALVPATYRSPLVAREMIKGIQMRELSSARVRWL